MGRVGCWRLDSSESFAQYKTITNCINNYLEFKISTLAAECHLGHHLLKHHPLSMRNKIKDITEE